mgnify:CR=1 FL=1
MNGASPPGSLSEGAAERSEAEGVYFGERNRSKIQSSYELVCKSLAWSNHRGTLPQSRICSTAPSEREPGGVRTIRRTARKPQRCGRFSSPLRNSVIFTGYEHRGTLPQSALRADSSLREGAGDGCTTQRAARKPQRCGRFSSPLRRGGYHSLGKSGVGADAPTPLGVSGRDEITVGYLAQASIWLWISAMMSSRPESRMVASMVATVCSGSWVPVIRMGRYSL